VSVPVCVDASIFLGLVLNDHRRPLAERLWTRWIEEGRRLVAPPLFRVEVCSVLRFCNWKGEIAYETALALLTAGLRSPVEVWDAGEALHTRAFELAARFGHSRAYDAHYLAVAELSGGELWTADKRLVNSVAGQFSWVHALEEAA
jgi:predicted nucleic acid-binding protein